MKGYMYILKCADDSYYTGSTNNLENRIMQHQNGEGANHTKKRLPVSLVYYEEFDRIDDAFYREKQVQGWSRAKKEALINAKITADKIDAEYESKKDTLIEKWTLNKEKIIKLKSFVKNIIDIEFSPYNRN